jgi:hypothetical protein
MNFWRRAPGQWNEFEKKETPVIRSALVLLGLLAVPVAGAADGEGYRLEKPAETYTRYVLTLPEATAIGRSKRGLVDVKLHLGLRDGTFTGTYMGCMGWLT